MIIHYRRSASSDLVADISDHLRSIHRELCHVYEALFLEGTTCVRSFVIIIRSVLLTTPYTTKVYGQSAPDMTLIIGS